MPAMGGTQNRRHTTSLEGVSPWAEQIRRQIRQVAAHDSNVLITGPTGTGKELIARAIHSQSERAAKPFVPVDCAALPGELFVGQLFGHLKGAFTGAHYAALGAFRAAEGGTIFLDEIGELEFPLQAKLLRVLQERIVVPLGSHQGEPVDVRVVSATNRQLESEIQAGRFRADLFYRLNVISLQTQSLAQRPEDIEPLALRFLGQLNIERGMPLKHLTADALQQLTTYDWPGNVRQLFHFLERAAVLSTHDQLDLELLAELGQPSASCMQPAPSPVVGTPPPVPAAAPAPAPMLPATPDDRRAPPASAEPVATAWASLAEVERSHILRTLQKVDFNQTMASELLQIDRHALRRKIRKYDIELP